MGTFILLLVIFFIIIPLGKALWRGYQFHKQWKKATRSMRDAFNQSTRQQSAGAGSQKSQSSRFKKKKINPDVGEYVVFEEISCNVGQSSAETSSETRYSSESQVEDAVWEDIK
ncbi:MAG: DUF4834 family protein [Muribaculaceae bacterium]